MKIKKYNTNLKEAMLKEEDTVPEEIKATETTVDELADTIQAGSELEAKVESEPEAALTDDQAEEVAKDTLDAAKKLGPDTTIKVVCTDNAITKALDRSYRNAMRNRRLGISDSRNNILINGLPGSGKTAIVSSWCEFHKVPLFYLNVKTNELEAAINGYMIRDEEKKNSVTKATSSLLDPLRGGEDKNGNKKYPAVLFLDEYNRQTNLSIRGTLLTLIHEHRIQGPDGYEYLPNILFTVACINPPTRRAAKEIAPLTDAENDRFPTKLIFDSKVKDHLDYMRKSIPEKIKKLEKKLAKGEIDEKTFKNDVAVQLRELELVQKIESDPNFHFTGRGTIDDYDNDEAQLSSRTITSWIDNAEGRKDEFLDLVTSSPEELAIMQDENKGKNVLGKPLPNDQNMFKVILDDYVDPKIVFYRDADGNLHGKVADDDNGAYEELPDDETDTSLFGSGQAAGNKAAISALEAKDRIVQALKM